MEEFKDDERKMYVTIPTTTLDKMRRITKGVPIDGCQKAWIISLFPDGSYQIRHRLCNCSCLMGRFNECLLHPDDVCQGISDDNLLQEIYELDETDDTVVGNLFVFAEPGNYIALYSAHNFELFYLFYVNKKEVAIEAKTDIYGHIVQEGEGYFEGYYLERANETKQRVYYKKLTKRAMFTHQPCSVQMFLLMRTLCAWKRLTMRV